MANWNRREALRVLGAGALAPRVSVAAGPALRTASLDHVEFLVSDVQKSLKFYTRVFGVTVLKNNRTSRRYVKLGPAFIAFDQGQQPGRVDHFCAGVEGFEIASVHSH